MLAFDLICQVFHCPLHGNLSTWRDFQKRFFYEEQILMKSILRLAEMSNLSALSILFVSVLNEVVVSFLGYLIWMKNTCHLHIPFNLLGYLVFDDRIMVPKVPCVDMACPVNNHDRVQPCSEKNLPCIVKCSKHDGSCHSLFVIGFWSVTLILASALLQMQKCERQSLLT